MKYVSLLVALALFTACSHDYVGMSVPDAEAKATAAGVQFRVVKRDGESLAVTKDYRPGRINATVENDVVVSYEIEGEAMSSSSATSDTPQTEDEDYIGMTAMQAEAKASLMNVPFRVVMRDGESLPVTMDYRPGRINATVEGDIVVSYEVEGEGQ